MPVASVWAEPAADIIAKAVRRGLTANLRPEYEKVAAIAYMSAQTEHQVGGRTSFC
jgi:hypothetical protein